MQALALADASAKQAHLEGEAFQGPCQLVSSPESFRPS
jgi:hypothetical protein